MAKKIDETIIGGRYRIGDQWVDANGNPIDGPKPTDGSADDGNGTPANPLAKWPSLAAAGYDSVAKVSAASDADLKKLDGIDDTQLAAIREVAPKKSK